MVVVKRGLVQEGGREATRGVAHAASGASQQGNRGVPAAAEPREHNDAQQIAQV